MTTYTPHGAVRRLFDDCRAERVLVEGPAGTGKTTGIQWYTRVVCEKYPGVRVLWMRQTRKSMTESVLNTWENKVLGPHHSLVKGKASRQFRQSYDFANGSSIVLAGLDDEAKTYSAEFDLVVVFEAIETRREKVEGLLRSLRNGKWKRWGNEAGFHQLVMDTNPGPQSHWLNVAANEGWLTRLHSRHEDNPMLWDGSSWTKFGAKYIETLDSMTGARRERLRFGRWASSEGMVYDTWDSAINVIDTMPNGWRDWKKLRSMDFGYTNPFVCQWWAIDNDGRMYMYRELYESGKSTKQHAQTINRLSEGETYAVTVSDHDADTRATLAENGVYTTLAQKSISSGIQMVATRMAKAGDGKPRLYILRDALHHRDAGLAEKRLPCSTVEEIDGYVWATNTKGIKEEPVDKDNHGCDAMRYGVSYIDGVSTPSVSVVMPNSTTDDDNDDDWR